MRNHISISTSCGVLASRLAIAGLAAITLAAPFITPMANAAEPSTTNTTVAAASAKATAGAFTANGQSFDSFNDALAAAAKADDKTVTINESVGADARLSIANTYEGVTITAAKDVTFAGSLRINASGVTVKGVSFTLDPATNTNAQNVIVSGKATGVTITDNTFTIAAGDPATGASKNKDWQPSSVWLENGATNTSIKGNTFKLGQVVNNSAVGVNIIGNGTLPITGTTIADNTVTSGPKSGEGTSGSMMFVVGNGNTQAGSYGIVDTTISGNTVKNGTGLSADASRTYAFAVTATKNTVIDGNTAEGYAAVSYSVWPQQGPNDGLKVTSNELDAFVGVLMGGYVTEGGLTVQNNTFGEETKYTYNGVSTYVTDQDGKAYSSVAKAIEAGATTVTLLQNVTEDVIIPAGKTITLDLAGHTLTNKAGHTITNNGTLTIKDSSAKKTGVVDNVTHQKAALSNEEGATATLEGGTFKRSKETGTKDNTYYTLLNHGDITINEGTTVQLLKSDGSHASYSSLIDNGWYSGKPANGKNATLTINGGTFEGGNYIKNDSYGELTINGGTVKGTSAAVFNWNKTTINGGEFSATTEKGIVIWNGGGSVDKDTDGANVGQLTINGGTFTATGEQKTIGQYTGALTEGQDNKVEVKVSGGTFKGALAEDLVNAQISGGTFTVAPKSEYVVEGSGLVKNEDGTFGVKKAVLTLGNEKVTYDVAKGELTADAATKLVNPSVNVEGYTVKLDEDQLAKLNEAIKNGEEGDFKLTFTATKDGTTDDTVSATATITLTKAEKPAPNPEPSDKPGTNPSTKPTTTTPSSGTTTNANGTTGTSQLSKTGTAIAGISAAAIALLAIGGIAVALRRRRA
ncbi:hypothetical protein KIH77_01885 [Bifidobacterium sp. 82T24]|uniref:hypothetical protein n=1 Tax=Bifidobacterium pluvialisilvae TaxID=2834436 RepID=UPI001C560C76|nr:hypothetical protein [Bifidobacterium pluvialisilvae]MBW3087495.1 hypothetical protein [Bifidobacterium pluvialisilvae]